MDKTAWGGACTCRARTISVTGITIPIAKMSHDLGCNVADHERLALLWRASSWALTATENIRRQFGIHIFLEADDLAVTQGEQKMVVIAVVDARGVLAV